MSHNKVFIDGFSYELGEQINELHHLDEIVGDQGVIDNLKACGLKNYRTSNMPLLTFAKGAIDKFFKKAILKPSQIDLVIFCTKSFWSKKEFSEKSLSNFLYKLDLHNAYLVASSFSFCGNFLTGVRTAQNYLKSENIENALVVVVDRTQEGDSRLVPPSISIGSDAASCCLVTKKPTERSYEISGLSQSINCRAGILDQNKDFLEYTKAVRKGITENISKTLEMAYMDRSQIDQIITNNYNDIIIRGMEQVANLPNAKLEGSNISRFAHAGASDICINCADYLQESRTENVLLLSSGPLQWGTAILRRIEKK